MPENLDLIIAVAVFLIALLVFFLVKTGVMPLKAIPYAVGSLLGLVGIVIFKAKRGSQLGEKIDEQKQELDERATRLEAMKKDLESSQTQHVEEKRKLDEAEAAHIKTMETLKAKDDAERTAIADMSTSELFAKFANKPQQPGT